eukprot:scaffold427721_cov33-Prasinocladus_malaysianus.AAC.1
MEERWAAKERVKCSRHDSHFPHSGQHGPRSRQGPTQSFVFCQLARHAKPSSEKKKEKDGEKRRRKKQNEGKANGKK